MGTYLYLIFIFLFFFVQTGPQESCACCLYLLEEAKRLDDLHKRRQSRSIRNLYQITSDRDYIRNYRLIKDLRGILEDDLVPFLPQQVRRGGLSHHTKVIKPELPKFTTY